MLVEREAPQATLRSLATDAGRGAIALVSGEAGIGKTTLLQAFRDTLDTRSHHVMWGACDPLDTPRVLGPVHDMRADFSPVVQQLLKEESSFSQLIPAILAELESGSSPVIMVFEDAHWADKVTLDLLKCIGRRISFLNTLLVISYRLDEIGPRHPLTQVLGDFPQTNTHRIELQPISAAGVKEMSQASGHNENDLREITGGNPFFLTELLAAADASDSLVPASVQDAISARLNRLPVAEQDFLEIISIIPYAIEPFLLTELFGENAEQLAENCVGRQLLRYDNKGALRFRHELARLGTMQRVPEIRRKKIHQQLVGILLTTDQGNRMEQIVCHASGARMSEQVLKFAPLVARNASTSGAHQEAASHLATALEFVDSAPPELAASLYENWSYEAGLLQIEDSTIEARYKALSIWRELKRADKEGENLRWLSRLHWYRGEAAEANRFLDESISVLENSEPSAERAMAYSLKSQFYMLNDRMEEAIHWGKKALETEQQFPSAEVRIHAGNNIGTAMLFRDNLEGLEYMQNSLSLSLQHDLHEHAARVYTNLADYAVGCRNFALAEKTIADGIVFDTNHDLDTWTHYLIGLLASLRMKQGRLEEAETIAQGVVNLDNQTLLMKLPSLLVLSKTRLRLGKKDAGELLYKALENALSTGELQYILPARLGLVESAWMSGDTASALEQIDHILSAVPAPEDTWRGAELHLWLHRFGVSNSKAANSNIPEPFQLEIDGDHRQSAQTWMKLGSPYQAALALMHSNRGSSIESLAEALTLLEAMFATGAIRKLKSIAQTLEIEDQLPLARRGPRKTSRQHPLGLTKKEQEIIPLVIQGMSNKEISSRMSRSSRTVENHVSSILKKLNVSNRMEAMLRFKNEPWLVVDSVPD